MDYYPSRRGIACGNRDGVSGLTEKNNTRKTKLENGLTILTEQMPHVRSVAVGVWVRSGSRVEEAETNGMSHFIEHTVFKGTNKRTVRQIAADMDSVGGQIDAFTSKEMVCFNTRVMDEHLPQAFDILADMVLDPIFPEDELQRETNVILEEIRMDEDNPEYLAQEIFSLSFWPGHPLGRPILGTTETVPGFTRERVQEFYGNWYRPDHMFVTAAGRLEHDSFVELVTKFFAGLKPHSNGFRQDAPQHDPALTTRVKEELTQAQLCLGVPCIPITDERRYSMSLLTNILGGGMSSRLFQRVREQEGLAYSIYADWSSYRDAGCLGVYAGTAPETLPKLLGLVNEEIARMKREPVPAEELQRTKESLKGGLLLSLESTASRMGSLARQEMYFGRLFEVDEIIARIEAVTSGEIQQLANEFFLPEKTAATALGNLKDFSLARENLSF